MAVTIGLAGGEANPGQGGPRESKLQGESLILRSRRSGAVSPQEPQRSDSSQPSVFQESPVRGRVFGPQVWGSLPGVGVGVPYRN